GAPEGLPRWPKSARETDRGDGRRRRGLLLPSFALPRRAWPQASEPYAPPAASLSLSLGPAWQQERFSRVLSPGPWRAPLPAQRPGAPSSLAPGENSWRAAPAHP